MIRVESDGHRVAARLRAVVTHINVELSIELHSLAHRVSASMRQHAPTFRSTLTNSIRAERETAHSWFVGPHTEYAIYVEKGRRPGKGLPRFSDPEAAAIVAWLKSKISGHKANFVGPLVRGEKAWRGQPRRNSRAAVQANLELRDRYMALSRYVRWHGIKARPFVAETTAEYRDLVPRALHAAVQRVLSATGVKGNE